MKRKLGIFWGLVGAVAVSAMSVSASTFETLPDSGDYEKIVALADEIVSSTNGGPVYDPFSEGVTVENLSSLLHVTERLAVASSSIYKYVIN